jgi:ATP-dependent helicase HrpB
VISTFPPAGDRGRRPSSTDRLPIDAVLPQVMEALDGARRAVLVAAPGAGKTTRVPLALLEAPWRGDGRVLVLEPRRLAARAAARRMAATLGEEVGATVGYRVRLDSQVSARTRIEVVTEGVFTRMLLDDPELTGVAAVLFDEFHERSLEGDFGLALALDAAQLRDDLRLLVMSATLDGARVSAVLGDVPVIVSEGRQYPVDTLHVPRDPSARLEEHVATVIRTALREQTGSILVFLPGQAEIRRVAEHLDGRLAEDIDVAPLHGSLDGQAQDRAIAPAPPGRRKVVLATSIAETSLTIEGVRVVVDAGLARVPRYEPGIGMTRLETVRVSRAGADQRRGRAGRTEPGTCYRLWPESQTSTLLPFDRPAILEADLAGLVLDLAAWGVLDPRRLAFLDPPPEAAWDEAVALLQSLDALDAAGRVTPAGRTLAGLPLHPRLAHMLLEGAREGDARTAALIAVLVSEPGLGGDAVDLSVRLDRLRTDRSPRAEQARQWAGRLCRTVSSGRDGSAVSPGLHLARAYPDRIAQARGGRGSFRLANGRGGAMAPQEALADEPWIVVADLTGQAASARIRLAAAIAREDLVRCCGGHLERSERMTFDPATASLRVRRIVAYRALMLTDEPVPPADPEAAAVALAEGLAAWGLERLPWNRDQRVTLERARFLHATLGGDWPDLSEAALRARAAHWLAPALYGKASLQEVDAGDLGNALERLLPFGQRQRIDQLLPSHFEAPTGNRLPIDYAGDNGPTLSVRVQELFGLDRHPSVGGGRIPLLLVLLSPAHRPIQTTRDLPGFWRGSWKEVVRDLKGRYPKHPWPDDPLSAAPTARAKPRRS